jgi:putative transposase
MDFVSDALANGRHIKVLTIVTRSLLIWWPAWHFGAICCASAGANCTVSWIALGNSHRSGTGVQEQGAGSMAYQNGVQLKLIDAGKPTQNAYIESFNGAFVMSV